MYGTSPLEIMAAEAMLKGLVYLDQFTYPAVFTGATALGSLGTAQVQIQINGDSDFICQEIDFTCFTNTTTINASLNALMTITRAGSGRELMSQPVHIQNMAGNYWNNSVPGKLPMPGLIQMSNVLTVTLQNLRAQAEGRVDVAFRGFKVFYTGGDRRNIFHAL